MKDDKTFTLDENIILCDKIMKNVAHNVSSMAFYVSNLTGESVETITQNLITEYLKELKESYNIDLDIICC